jgi:hypothetical protein
MKATLIVYVYANVSGEAIKAAAAATIHPSAATLME